MAATKSAKRSGRKKATSIDNDATQAQQTETAPTSAAQEGSKSLPAHQDTRPNTRKRKAELETIVIPDNDSAKAEESSEPEIFANTPAWARPQKYTLRPCKASETSRTRPSWAHDSVMYSLLGDKMSGPESLLSFRQTMIAQVSGPDLTLIDKYTDPDRPQILDPNIWPPSTEKVRVAEVQTDSNPQSSQTRTVRVVNADGQVTSVLSRNEVMNTPVSSTLYTGLENACVAWLPRPKGASECWLLVGGMVSGESTPRYYSFGGGSGVLTLCSFVDGQVCVRARFHHPYGPIWQIKAHPHARPLESTSLALVALLCNDGIVRILDIPSPPSPHTQQDLQLPTPTHTLQPASRTPNITACDWLHPTAVVCGTDNGMLMVWSVGVREWSDRPVWCSSVHLCGVGCVSSGYPSVGGSVLSCGWDGETKVTSGVFGRASTRTVSRARVGGGVVGWCDLTRLGVCADETRDLLAFSLRHHKVGNLKTSNHTLTALATAPTHPYVLAADAAGTLTLVNPFRRFAARKLPPLTRVLYRLDIGRPGLTHDRERWQYRFTERFNVDVGVASERTYAVKSSRPAADGGGGGGGGGAEEEDVKKELANSHAGTVLKSVFPEPLAVRGVSWCTDYGKEHLVASCTRDFLRVDRVS
ncbi:hypothetical protein PYCC9005_005816 [Savitreella phatthalungensis]